MRSGWDRVTKWAGIGNNGSDAETGDEMVDEMKDGLAQESGMGTVERVEAGMEIPGEPASSAELEQLTAERDQLKDRLARLQAEFDNARKRETKERTDAREYTIGNTVEPFLSVMDNFGWR